jgi:hypothetical protein
MSAALGADWHALAVKVSKDKATSRRIMEDSLLRLAQAPSVPAAHLRVNQTAFLASG